MWKTMRNFIQSCRQQFGARPAPYLLAKLLPELIRRIQNTAVCQKYRIHPKEPTTNFSTLYVAPPPPGQTDADLCNVESEGASSTPLILTIPNKKIKMFISVSS